MNAPSQIAVAGADYTTLTPNGDPENYHGTDEYVSACNTLMFEGDWSVGEWVGCCVALAAMLIVPLLFLGGAAYALYYVIYRVMLWLIA